jgi:hypothetical protein
MGTCAIGNIKMKRDMCVEKIRQVHLRRGGGFFFFFFGDNNHSLQLVAYVSDACVTLGPSLYATTT